MVTVDSAAGTQQPARVDVTQYAGKDHMLSVLRGSRAAFFDLMERLNEDEWIAQTPCSQWQVRDLVGHIVDVTEAYLVRWAMARNNQPAGDAVGLRDMARLLDADARRFRDTPKRELLVRLKESSDGLFEVFDRLDENQWAGEIIEHVYMGPVPAYFYPAFQLMDYGVHGWDAREAVGHPTPLTEDEAGILIRFMFGVMQGTVDTAAAEGLSACIGIQIPGVSGGTWNVRVADGALTYEEEALANCDVVFTFPSASDFVLTAFQRIKGGTYDGDAAVAERFRRLFFTI